MRRCSRCRNWFAGKERSSKARRKSSSLQAQAPEPELEFFIEFGKKNVRFKLHLVYYVSSLKREDAKRYRRRHSSRLISTTTVAIMSVAASNTSKRPASLALLMVLPRPGVETIRPRK